MRIKKSLFLFLMFFIIVSGKAQNKSQTAEVSKDDVVEIGYVNSFENLPKLKLDKISQSEFENYKSEISFTNPKIKQDKRFFYLKTKKQNHKFKKFAAENTSSESKTGNIFIGFYPGLKLFALNDASVSEGIMFGNLVLIDEETDYKYKIISIGDGSVENPIPSKNNKFLVYYHNYDYQHKNSFIGVLKVNGKSSPKKFLQEHLSFESDYFAVEKIIWTAENAFVVKGFEEIFENQKWVKKYSYYKTSFE